uniref:Uncharacterized protein n=1 Tax=Rhizophora mucronata TaxID=61149 RepID=A0A2P2P241_RHIMU
MWTATVPPTLEHSLSNSPRERRARMIRRDRGCT